MNTKKGYHSIPLTFNRRAVRASASVTKEKNVIHSVTEIDITEPRQIIREYFEKSGEKISLTAYIVTCLAHVLKDHPMLNSFIKGRKLYVLNDVTVSVLIEREITGEKVPEPIGIDQAQLKSVFQIQKEIREAKSKQGDKLGSLSGQAWIRFIPIFLLKTFIRIADKNIYMARRYGKVCVTAIGMFSKEAVWFIPHGSATVLLTVGSISDKVVKYNGEIVTREHLCLTVSFDHDIVDGAPAARFMNQLTETIKGGVLLETKILPSRILSDCL
jgi:pyruvate/2-oxoglutarate dehydrogenase complex dihydrolipoamide acyltransferase (E2) component